MPSTPGEYRDSGFGSYCIQCHASADNELTFASLNNIESDFYAGKLLNFGQPLRFIDDRSWVLALGRLELGREYSHHAPDRGRPESPGDAPGKDAKREIAAVGATHHSRKPKPDGSSAPAPEAPAAPPEPALNPEFARQFELSFSAPGAADVECFPGEGLDRVVQLPGHRQFVTSDQCMSCHAGNTNSFGPNMFLNGKGYKSTGMDISPWGEWRWSMMGLAGRDPVFHAQLESEMTAFKAATGEFRPEVIADTCLKCHGVMAQRQFHLDPENAGRLFPIGEVFADSRYGALARDGVSCMVCHQQVDNSAEPLKTIMTGEFGLLPVKDGLNQIIGPYDEVKTEPMRQALGMLPAQSHFIGTSRSCASCHTINLPVLDGDGKPTKWGFEQATYLEWVNSDYFAGARPAGAARAGTPRSCQSCHMRADFSGKKIDTKIASIQDSDYPTGMDGAGEALQAHNLLPAAEISLKSARHSGATRSMGSMSSPWRCSISSAASSAG